MFVADEVQTGFARTGAMFACEHEGVVPDLIVTAKGIAGGLPLSAVTGRAEIMDAVARRRPRRHVRRQPDRLRRRARRDRDVYRGEGLVARAREIERVMLDAPAPPAGRATRASATSAAAAPWSPSSSSRPGTDDARRRRSPRRSRPPPTPRASSC